jgi:hypothetical protein
MRCELLMTTDHNETSNYHTTVCICYFTNILILHYVFKSKYRVNSSNDNFPGSWPIEHNAIFPAYACVHTAET